MFYKIYEEKLAVYDDNKERLLSTMSFMPQLENERLLETDIVTADELNEHPNKVLVDDIQIEIEVPEYETITEEYEEVVSETDIMGEPIINIEIKTREVTVQTGSHTEIITVKGLVLNPDFEAEQAQKEAERIQELYMTRSDFFDGTIQAWGVGQDELLVLIQTLLATLPIEDVKKLMAINNFRNALNFYRKHDLFKMLVNIPIQLTETIQVIITDEHLDKFFDEVDKGNKATAWQYLPQPVQIPLPEEAVEVEE
ncbi:MAG: hypothetical protein IJX99_05720 [Clostridia bacterium]|nr:hypothetical protein [Clostridia bacterium]